MVKKEKVKRYLKAKNFQQSPYYCIENSCSSEEVQLNVINTRKRPDPCKRNLMHIHSYLTKILEKRTYAE